MSTERTPTEDEAETVYIVDDDEHLRASLERLIRSIGWRARCYEGAEAFLASVPSADVGCVLLDLHLSGMDGLRAFRAIRMMGCNLPVVFLTGYGDVESCLDAMKRGAADFLLKPIDDEALVSTVRVAMARYRDTKASEAEKAMVQRRLASLSRRERDVLQGVLLGKLNKQIAADLGIAEKTVKAHRSRVMEKTEATTVAALVLMCAKAGASTTPSFLDAPECKRQVARGSRFASGLHIG
jgi:FixJ family two-component response regulator